MASFKKHTVVILLISIIFGCNQEPTLQTYFVDNELKPGFSTVDIPKSILNIDEASLSKEESEAFKSIDKLNILSFVISEDNKPQYQTELKSVESILNNPMYEQLVRGGNNIDGKFMINFVGDEEDIDELVFFGYSDNKGFIIVRVLGDKMTTNKMLNLRTILDKVDWDSVEFEGIKDLF